MKMSIDAGTKVGIALTPSMRRGIEMLSVAYGYAKEVQRDAWEFALEIQCLSAAGVNNSELRWLVCKGLARHAEEKVSHGKKGRIFQNLGDVTFSPGSCFVLTEEGYETFKSLSNRQLATASHNGTSVLQRESQPAYRPTRRPNR
jgi:hypothetical protein